MAKAKLHRDKVDGSIVLMRLPGDCWTVARDQADCDFIRQTERRFRPGYAGDALDVAFVRVKPVKGEGR